MDDLAAILGGSAPKAARTYDPIDAAVRTVYGEAPPNATREERQAIASVIVNRARQSGKTFDQVVQEPGQFEPWGDAKARKRLDALKATDKDYQSIAADVADVLSGKASPHPDLTHFYAPDAQAALGRDKPSWDDGTGKRIGAHAFFARGDAPAGHEDLAGMLGASTAAPSGAEGGVDAEQAFKDQFGDPSKFDGAGEVGFTKGPGSLDKEQTALLATFEKGGFIDRDAPVGSERNPRWVTGDTTEKDVPAGEYYVTRGGGEKVTMKRAPGGEAKSSAAAGFGQGLGDVGLSIAQMLPGSQDSELRARMEAGQMAYDAGMKGDLKSGVGRFTGQMVGAVPLLAGGEAAIAPMVGRAIPAATTLLGKGAQMVAGGAAEGAGAAALTSSASDKPISDQLEEGAVVGGLLKPALPLVRGAGRKVGATVRSFTEPLTEKGRDKIASRIINDVAGEPLAPDVTQIIPGSAPTLAEATGNAGVASLERNAMTHPRLAQKFLNRQQDTNAARTDFFEKLKGDEHTLADLHTARDAATGKLREAAFKGAKAADPTAAISKIDEILASPSGQRDAVVTALNRVKGKLESGGAAKQDITHYTAEELQKDARDLGLNDFLDKHVSELLPAHIEANLAPKRVAHGQFKVQDLSPTEHDTWDEVARMSDSSKQQVDDVAKDIAKGAPPHPVLVEDNGAGFDVIDGHHRAAGAIQAGSSEIPGAFTAQALTRIWKTAHGSQERVSALLRAYESKHIPSRAGGERLKPVAGEKTPQNDVEQLYGIRKDIGDMLSPLASSDAKSARLASSELMDVKKAIDAAIEKAAPGFKGYLKAYETLSRPIDEQTLLQSLKITDAKQNITLGRVQSAIDRVEAMRKKGGTNQAKSLAADTLRDLKALRDDLKRGTNIDLGKARGSDTAQNLVMGQVAGKAGVPLGVAAGLASHPIVGAALAAGKGYYGRRGEEVLDKLGNRLLNPETAAPVVRKPQGRVSRFLGNAGAKALPAAGAIAVQ